MLAGLCGMCGGKAAGSGAGTPHADRSFRDIALSPFIRARVASKYSSGFGTPRQQRQNEHNAKKTSLTKHPTKRVKKHSAQNATATIWRVIVSGGAVVSDVSPACVSPKRKRFHVGAGVSLSTRMKALWHNEKNLSFSSSLLLSLGLFMCLCSFHHINPKPRRRKLIHKAGVVLPKRL